MPPVGAAVCLKYIPSEEDEEKVGSWKYSAKSPLTTSGPDTPPALRLHCAPANHIAGPWPRICPGRRRTAKLGA